MNNLKTKKKNVLILGKTAILIVLSWMVITNFPAFFFGLYSCVWPKTQGTVIENRLVEKHTGKGSLWQPQINYIYSVNNKNYTGSKESFSTFIFGKQWAADILEKYPLKSNVEVFYHPFNHKTSCLKPGPEIAATLYSAGGTGGILCILLPFFRKKS